MVLALAVFAFTLFLVIVQPKGLGIGWGAALGAIVALALGVVRVANIPTVWGIVWNATLTFVGLIIISLVLDEAGFFHWAALHMARSGGGRGRRLFPLIILLGALVAALFANDGAALILTPIVLAMLVALGFSPEVALAFVMGTGFIADTTSLPFVISNLVNIVSADFFGIPFRAYAIVMIPVDVVAGLVTFAMLWIYYRRDIPEHYDLHRLESPRAAIKDPLLFRLSWPVLGLLLASYFLAGRLHVPVSLLTGLAAVTLLLVAARIWRAGEGAVIPIRRVLREAPWQIVLFSLGMYLVVYGLRDAGLTAWLARLLSGLAAHGFMAATIGTGVLTALLSAVMNNMPTVLVGSLAIHHLGNVPAPTREAMIYANIIGCDIGPKFTPLGSLATLLWLHVLARKGETISWRTYMRAGLVMTPVVLVATLAALGLWLQVLR
ncbi:arsenic transporter [Acidiferrobacter sp.]|uniref:arsenic transporter n=1 Tax=Acidiferrobacter sp. TaxID=1872107 RepID=UPI00261093D2|nr:arsenic transporter [Acidiferrobacter sp.]